MRSALDSLDISILQQLQDDGRRPFTRIAKDLGVAEGTVRHRVGRLARRRLVKFVADVDAIELGLIMAYVLVQVRGSSLARAVEALERIPEVDYMVNCAGSADLLLEVVCQDHEHLLRLLGEEIRKAPGVEHIETFTALRIAKDTYRWAGLEAAGNGATISPQRAQG
jgi:Lrp/AsnC family transcriptional regulator for asnA, asnC and gidA